MKNYWLDQANLSVKSSRFEFSEQYGILFKTELSNGHKLESWIDKEGMLNTGRSWYVGDEDADPGILYMGMEYEMHERLAEEKFSTMVSQNWTDVPVEPLTGAFAFFLSGTEVWCAANVQIVPMDDMGIAIKFLSRVVHSDYPCYLESDINELAHVAGALYVTCPLGQLVLKKAKMWAHTINGYYLFLQNPQWGWFDQKFDQK